LGDTTEVSVLVQLVDVLLVTSCRLPSLKLPTA